MDLKESYCSSVTHLALTAYRLVTSDMRLNSIKQIQPALVFVGILIAIPSGLLFHNQSCAICSCRTPSFLFTSGKTLLMVPAREMVVASDGYKYNVNPCSGKRRSIDSRRGPSCHFSA